MRQIQQRVEDNPELLKLHKSLTKDLNELLFIILSECELPINQQISILWTSLLDAYLGFKGAFVLKMFGNQENKDIYDFEMSKDTDLKMFYHIYDQWDKMMKEKLGR
jgi:hypothetical protein